MRVAGRLDLVVVVFNDNSADKGECTWHSSRRAVGKWRRGGRSATGVSDLPKSNEALREVSFLTIPATGTDRRVGRMSAVVSRVYDDLEVYLKVCQDSKGPLARAVTMSEGVSGTAGQAKQGDGDGRRL
jgi:hypothetical protein